MKNISKPMLLLLLVINFLTGSEVFSQTEKTQITKSYQFPTEAKTKIFYLANINGSINIHGHDAKEIILKAEKTITAKTKEALEMGKSLQVGHLQRGDSVIIYIEGACPTFEYKKGGHRAWRYDWDDCHQDDPQFQFDFDVAVPANAQVVVSTVNNGDISVDKIEQAIFANNINGSITLNNIIGQVRAHTINGHVNLHYLKNPEKSSRFYSLNGNINAHYIKNLSADLSFKSFNGELFTNIKEWEHQPVMVRNTKGPNGTTYKVGDKSEIKIRGGGVQLDFETFNGNVYIKEQ